MDRASSHDYMTASKKLGRVDPRISVDVIVEIGTGEMVLIYRRWQPVGWALPGGRVDYGEPLWQAAVREVKEETSFDIELIEQFYTYSDPKRASHKHSITTVFIAKANGTPIARDDATAAKCFNIAQIPQLMFDHNEIVNDYLRWKSQGVRPGPIRFSGSSSKSN